MMRFLLNVLVLVPLLLDWGEKLLDITAKILLICCGFDGLRSW